MRGLKIFACLGLTAAMTVTGTAVAVAKSKGGFKTSRPAMLMQGDITGVQITPLLTVGDRVGNYRFESIPDGISLRRKDHNRLELFVNHETGKSPFPWSLTGGNNDTNFPAPSGAENDFDNSQLSRLTLNRDGEVRSGSLAITSSLGFQRFCSNYLATWREGFTRDILFTNEESPDYFLREEDSGRPRLATRTRRRLAWSSRTTRRTARSGRSPEWAGTTTRTACRSPATATRSCSQAMTRSLAEG